MAIADTDKPDQAPAAQVYESDDVVLGRLLGMTAPQTEAPEAKPEAEAEAEPTSAPEPTPSDGTAQTTSQDSAQPEAAADTEAYQKALAALKLDRVPDDLIATLNPQQVLSLGNALKERQREINERLAQAKKADEESETEPEATKAAEPAEPTVAEDLKALTDRFSEYYGPEGGEVLTKLSSALERRFQEAFSSQAAQLEAAQGLMQQMLAERVRDQLRESTPLLANDDDYAKVVEQMSMLAATGRYANVAPTVDGRLRKLMQDSALLVGGGKPSPAPSPKQRSKTTPSPKPAASSTPKPLSPDELDDMALKLLERGLSAVEVEKQLQGLRP